MILIYFGEATFNGSPSPAWGVVSPVSFSKWCLPLLVHSLFENPDTVFGYVGGHYCRGRPSFVVLFARNLPNIS